MWSLSDARHGSVAPVAATGTRSYDNHLVRTAWIRHLIVFAHSPRSGRAAGIRFPPTIKISHLIACWEMRQTGPEPMASWGVDGHWARGVRARRAGGVEPVCLRSAAGMKGPDDDGAWQTRRRRRVFPLRVRRANFKPVCRCGVFSAWDKHAAKHDWRRVWCGCCCWRGWVWCRPEGRVSCDSATGDVPWVTRSVSYRCATTSSMKNTLLKTNFYYCFYLYTVLLL